MSKRVLITMSYKDYKAVWDRINAEANIEEVVKPLTEDATAEERESRYQAICIAKLFGVVMSQFCLELTGMFPEQLRNSWERSEELFDVSELTDRLMAFGLSKILGIEVSESNSERAEARTLELYRKMPGPVFTFWLNLWLEYTYNMYENIFGEEEEE